MLNPYTTLGISSNCSLEDAKVKYRELCKKYHPDNPITGNRAKLEEVLKAWKLLQEVGFSTKNEIWGHGTLFSIKRRKI